MKLVAFKDNHFYFDRDVCPDDSSFHNPVHYHDLYEIYFITEGSCDYFIDNRSYHLVPGDLVLIPEGIIHNTVYHNTGHSRMLINCARRYIPAAVQLKGYLYRNPAITGEIREIFETIRQEYTHPDRWSEDAIACRLKLLFYLLARHENACSFESECNETVTRAVAFLQQHFTEDVSLTDMARYTAVSPEHFSRLFKKETGFGFREYLNLLRLQKAEQLLKQFREATVAEIAAECGFADSNYFSVKFKKMYGISPKKLQRPAEG